ncbi:DUF3397 domain-containing protein [Cohnella faecalis]|uniref:DUF3397 domain-containing protein n=1 Tax=Cohnella faecalis TaxID=2315694 RepID=A0A398CWP0_9BACL|nr:DUF3397 domain-containing protein [Cohnella faecalis]RIE04247.1 DUF3397 domain-containing protein [Cohnella faecalis]
MDSVWKSLVDAYAALAAFPVIPFLFVYFVERYRSGDKKRAFRLAMDVTTAFLLGCVGFMLNRRIGSSLGLYFILLLMLIGAGLIGNAQTRLRGKIDVSKIFRAIWRLSFFAMAVLYVLLMSLELIMPSITQQ